MPFAISSRISAILACLLLSLGTASACEPVHALRIDVQTGTYEIFLNDVFLYKGDETSGPYERPFTDWIVPEKNEVTIHFEGQNGRFGVVEGCAGTLHREEPIDSAEFSEPGTRKLGFVRNEPVVTAYDDADIAADTEGLMQQVRKLQDAVRARDIDAVLAMHDVLLADYERQGADVEMVSDFIRHIVTNGDIETAEPLIARPVMGGRVYQVLGPHYEPPILASKQYDKESMSWESGTFWARFDDMWKLVSR